MRGVNEVCSRGTVREDGKGGGCGKPGLIDSRKQLLAEGFCLTEPASCCRPACRPFIANVGDVVSPVLPLPLASVFGCSQQQADKYLRAPPYFKAGIFKARTLTYNLFNVL